MLSDSAIILDTRLETRNGEVWRIFLKQDGSAVLRGPRDFISDYRSLSKAVQSLLCILPVQFFTQEAYRAFMDLHTLWNVTDAHSLETWDRLISEGPGSWLAYYVH